MITLLKGLIRPKHALILALALTAVGAHAQIVRVLMLNAAGTPLRVQGTDRAVFIDIAPNSGMEVVFNRPHWMTLKQKVYRYNTLSVQRLHNQGKKIVLQVGPDATIYLMPAGTTVPESPPPQPKGFPIRPDKMVTVK